MTGYFHISQTKSSFDRIFYKVVYHHIIYMCDFFREFRWLFCHSLHGFSQRLWFPPDKFPNKSSYDLEHLLDANDEGHFTFLWTCVASAKSSTKNTKEMVSYKNMQQNSMKCHACYTFHIMNWWVACISPLSFYK